MYQLVTGLFDTVRSWVGLVLPVFATAADFRHWPRWAWRVVHLLLLVAVLVGLYFLNRYLEVGRLLLLRTEWLQQFYLPLVFLLLYALSWLGFWLWGLLGGGGPAGGIPQGGPRWREDVRPLRGPRDTDGATPTY